VHMQTLSMACVRVHVVCRRLVMMMVGGESLGFFFAPTSTRQEANTGSKRKARRHTCASIRPRAQTSASPAYVRPGGRKS